ncbi:uncharacterized protein [Prorops nasuta]
MDFPKFHYHKITEIFMRSGGLWPHQDTCSARVRKLIIFLLLFISCLFQIVKLSRNYNGIDSLMNILPETLIVGVSFIDFIFLFGSFKNYSNTYDIICHDWNMEHTTEELEIKKSYGRMLKNLSAVVAAYTFVIFLPLTWVDKTMALANNETRQQVIPIIVGERLELIIIIQDYLAVSIASLFSMTNGLMVFFQILHFYGMLNVIKYRLENLSMDRDNKNNGESRKNDQTILRNLITCIKTHALAIELIINVENYYKPCILLVIGSSVLFLSLTILQALNLQGIQFKPIVFASGQLFFLAGLCFGGQLVLDASEEASFDV